MMRAHLQAGQPANPRQPAAARSAHALPRGEGARSESHSGVSAAARGRAPLLGRSLGLLAAMGALLALGCAAPSTRMPSVKVDDSLRDELPLEGRRWAYEAENEVIIALDRRDEAAQALVAAGRRLVEAERSQEVAKKNGKAAGPAAARTQWRQALRAEARARLDAAELGVYCARASFELTKARLAVRFGFPVKKDYVSPFEAQYESCAKEEAQVQQEVREAEVRAARALEGWRDSRREYVTQTGDHDHGLWID